MKKQMIPLAAAFACLVGCQHPQMEFADFDTFHVTSVKSTPVAMEDGTLNPEVMLMEDACLPETKVASTAVANLASDILGSVFTNSLIHISGTYTGHDIDGSPLVLSGKLLLPAHGPVKNMVIVSHFTIGANYECPSESFSIEGIVAAKGYAVVIADYIGFGVTAQRIHPYMHTESTARSVVDMALAVKPYLKHIGREPQSPEVYLMGYSQGGAITIGVMRMIQREYARELPIRKVFAGGGPYNLAATFDKAMELDQTGIPCAIPMIVQGVNEGEDLGLEMSDFFLPNLLDHYEEWINSKRYTVKQINQLMGARSLHELMTEAGRNKQNRETSRLYKALMINSVLDFIPEHPIYLFHSTVDETVPFVNALSAERYFKGYNISFDFDNYGNHGSGALRFIVNVAQQL